MTPGRGHVIVGASAAGISAAVALRTAGYAGSITVIDRDPNQPYERPPLSKSLLGDAQGSALKPILPVDTYRAHDIDLCLGVGVATLDVDRQRVTLEDGAALSAEHVVVATGVSARRLTVPGVELPNVLTLRDAADARAINECLSAGGPLVVVGGGFIGLELAAAAREHDIPVTVVELTSLPLVGVTGPDVARLVHRLHVENGVQFRLGVSVSSFVGASAVEAVELSTGERLPARTVVVGVGVVPNVALAEAAGVELDRHGIVVDRFGTTSVPWISAAGDVASQPHPALSAPGRIEHWDAAQRHGAAVGATVAGVPTSFESTPYAWSEQYGLMLQMFGRPHPGDEVVVRTGATASRFLAFWLRAGRLGAVAGLDASRDVAGARRLIDAHVPLRADQLRSPDLDIRRLLKTAVQASG